MSAPSSEARAPVDALVCNYNGRAHLEHCLPALEAQTVPPRRIVVLDNASSDDSAAWIAAHYPRVEFVRLEQNLGPGPARNKALEMAQGDWALLLDNDAVLEPDALERLLDCARAHPTAALIQPRSVFFDEPERVHYDGGAFHYCGLLSLRNFGVLRAQALGQGDVEVEAAVSVALLVRRAALAGRLAFDPGYFILFEDLDLSFRLRALGESIWSAEGALCRHRGGTGGISFRSGSYPRQRTLLHARNRWRFVLKCYAGRTLIVALPGLWLYEGAAALFALRQGTLGAWFLGHAQVVRSLPEILRLRREFFHLRRGAQACAAKPRPRDQELLVGGPLTVHPMVRSATTRLLSRLLAGWWGLVRSLAG